MNNFNVRSLLALSSVTVLAWALAQPTLAADEPGFKPIFDGKTLEKWDGNPDFWRVEDGCIVGETTKEKPAKGNTFLIWRGGEPGDFELKVEFKLRNYNSGIQIRSFEDEKNKWVVGGYQSDMDDSGNWTGAIYGERFRGVLAKRGQKVVIGEDHKPKVVGSLGDPKELGQKISKDGWNEYHIVCQGYKITQSINGTPMAELVDEDVKVRREKGIIALQLHAGPAMKVEFRNLRLKELAKAEDKSGRTDRKGLAALLVSTAALAENAAPAKKTKIVFIAGADSHGFDQHAHSAGMKLMEQCIKAAYPNVETVLSKGWPKDAGALDNASAIVLFSDGGGGNPMLKHMDKLDELMKKGVGFGCIHYAVEVPKGPKAGDLLKPWIGGYFETFWSVNPHWMAEFKQFPKHPVANGLKPFKLNDEWYYHMRFVDDMKGVTPILSAVPPEKTREGRDGPHSGNEHVRARKGQAEHVAWVVERPDGGRGFGTTGGHFHWNWGCDGFRTCVLNSIAWIAKLDIPAGGVHSQRPTAENLLKLLDRDPPKGFNLDRVTKLIEEANK